MSGAPQVCANMIAWEQTSLKIAEEYLKMHMAHSHEYALAKHPWQSQSGITQVDFYHDVFHEGTSIIGDVGYLSRPTTFASKGWWLENPNGNVNAYGNPNYPFGGRFKILERARGNQIGLLIAKLRALFAAGGTKMSFGRGSGHI